MHTRHLQLRRINLLGRTAAHRPLHPQTARPVCITKGCYVLAEFADFKCLFNLLPRAAATCARAIRSATLALTRHAGPRQPGNEFAYGTPAFYYDAP